MNDLDILLKGIAAGLIISAPVGPVNVLCISRTLDRGQRAGMICGLGAAAADTIYGSIAGFSVHFAISFLIREEYWVRLFGGALLIVIGMYYYFRKPRRQGPRKDEAEHPDYVSAFLLNLTNPTTVLSFLAVLAALGLQQHKSGWQGLLLVAGIFAGAMGWWLCVSALAVRFRSRLTDRNTAWMNRAAGVAIGAFGLIILVLNRTW
jgi:threonine/homoserine/homoserine lactone efflux protein